MNRKTLVLFLMFLALLTSPIFMAFPVRATERPDFSMVFMNDPQFFWNPDMDDVWHAITEVLSVRENYLRALAIDTISRDYDLKGVVINGDLVFQGNPQYDTWDGGAIIAAILASTLPAAVIAAPLILPYVLEISHWADASCAELFEYIYTKQMALGGLGDIDLFPGLGNHDLNSASDDIVVNFINTIDSRAVENHEWDNFPVEKCEIDWNTRTPPPGYTNWYYGSFAYKWDIYNYRFIQLHNVFDYTFDRGSNKYTIKSVDKSLLKSWIDEAYYRGLRVVLCVHDPSVLKRFSDVIDESNVVAIFSGHYLHEDPGLLQYYESGTITNAWGLEIPVFHGGHSGEGDLTGSKYGHKLLVATFEDYRFKVDVIDCNGVFGSYSVQDSSLWGIYHKGPEIEIFAKYPIYEGSYTTFASGEFRENDPHNDAFITYVLFGDGDGHSLGYTGTSPVNHIYTFNLDHKYKNNGIYKVKVLVMEPPSPPVIPYEEAIGMGLEFYVEVLNSKPIVNTVNPSSQVIFKGAPVTVTATFSDPGVLDTHTATVEWGDGSFDEGTVVEDDGSGTVTAPSHVYFEKGTHTVTVNVIDNDGGVGSKDAEINVILALSGFVIDEYHNKPLADVTITCDGKTTTTDASGYYEFTPLNPGECSVEMTIPLGYNSIVPSKTATITAGQETIVNFAAYPLPDIIFTKATVDTERLAGDTITYHITVDNQGDGPATNIVITDVLPNMTTFISSDASATTNGQTLTWSIDTLNEHTSTTIKLAVRTSLLIYPDTTLNNTVTVDFDDWKELPQTPKDASATTDILPTVPTENVQGAGYWKRQIKAVQDSKSCDYTESELLLLLEKIRVSSQIFVDTDTLEEAAEILATPTGKDAMEARARQQLFALWLNLAARAVAADTAVDLADLTTSTTVAEAITQCEAILLDVAPTKASCECSKEICDLLNNCEGLPW